MVKIINVDLLDTDVQNIAHQVNCQGAMRSGVAKQIRERFPIVYSAYKDICNISIKSTDLLGTVHTVVSIEHHKIIHNLFAQDRFGYNGQQYTCYKALQSCFDNLLKHNLDNGIAMPYGIGCGLGGGDWDIVFKMIEDTFSDIDVFLYKLKNDQNNNIPFYYEYNLKYN